MDTSANVRLSNQEPHLDLIFPIKFVVMQCVLRNSCASFVNVLDECDIFFVRNETNFVQVRVPVLTSTWEKR
jgi:hypothetical protein